MARKLSRHKLEQSWALLVCFHFSVITVLYCLLSSLLKTTVSDVLSCFSVVLGGKVNLVPVILSWLETHQVHFKL